MAFVAGWLIDGTNYQYKIVKVIGEGGFGITYLAKRNDGLDVVVKTLNDTMQNKPEFNDLQAKFMKEAFFLKGCKHPHIVKILDICQSVNLWCMVMENIDGETLWERVEKKGALSESEALSYIQQIGSALEYMHNLDEPLLHRDLNPKNIMIRRRTKDAVLIDFGLAREFVQDKTGKHTAMAFPGFAPIEQYDENAKRGAFTDVYGLAAALYFALTAECPTPSFNIVAGAALIPPRRIQPSIDSRVEKAILNGMKLKAKERPQSVQKWIDELIPPPPLKLPNPIVKQTSSIDELIPPPPLPKQTKPTVRHTSSSAVIKKDTWIALMISSAICSAAGVTFAIAQVKLAAWLLLVLPIVISSISPLVGDLLLKSAKKQGGLWKVLPVLLAAITGTNGILSTLVVSQMAIDYQKTFSFQDLLIVVALTMFGVVVVAVLCIGAQGVHEHKNKPIDNEQPINIGFAIVLTWIFSPWALAWFWAVNWALSWVRTWALSWVETWVETWAWALALSVLILLAVVLVVGGVALALALAFAWDFAWVWATEKLLESVGKWKATMILFSTGSAALGVGLLAKVLFVR